MKQFICHGDDVYNLNLMERLQKDPFDETCIKMWSVDDSGCHELPFNTRTERDEYWDKHIMPLCNNTP